jgi:hypothetical protein
VQLPRCTTHDEVARAVIAHEHQVIRHWAAQLNSDPSGRITSSSATANAITMKAIREWSQKTVNLVGFGWVLVAGALSFRLHVLYLLWQANQENRPLGKLQVRVEELYRYPWTAQQIMLMLGFVFIPPIVVSRTWRKSHRSRGKG